MPGQVVPDGILAFETAAPRPSFSPVGWVERSDTHQCWPQVQKVMGFASLYPSDKTRIADLAT
jgi:hypothetical protein